MSSTRQRAAEQHTAIDTEPSTLGQDSATQLKSSLAEMPNAVQAKAIQPEKPVQFNMAEGARPAPIHQIAAEGVAGGGGALP
ncbi:MAG: hypothetical protein KC561_12175, partial [Myxococcales bacterium]|nr:hypothetical protein [Myxococcales bacterium]